MERKDKRGVVIPAPTQFNNPATGSLPRYDDEHRGPAVTDAYELSHCRIDLAEHSQAWPLPENLPPPIREFAERIPEDQRTEWLRRQTASEEVDRLISYAMRSGELPIWVAPIGEPERLVAPGALIEVDHATTVSGCYRPPNDRGWLYGRPLFVKRDDWTRFVRSINRAKTPGTEEHRLGLARAFTRDDPASIAPWWSVNQALAWIVTRIPSYVEYIARLETDEPREHRPYIVQAICESQIAESEEGKAFIESRRASWPTGTFLAHAGRAMLEKILTGELHPLTREGGRGRKMGREEFVGVGLSETGGDWLDLEPQPLFSSAEVMKAFLAAGPDEGGGGGIVPSNRQLDHAKIITRAAALLKDQPSLSIGSAAASIVAELPSNPRTGKPRDTRHIERMIAHLWEGGAPESPA